MESELSETGIANIIRELNNLDDKNLEDEMTAADLQFCINMTFCLYKNLDKDNKQNVVGAIFLGIKLIPLIKQKLTPAVEAERIYSNKFNEITGLYGNLLIEPNLEIDKSNICRLWLSAADISSNNTKNYAFLQNIELFRKSTVLIKELGYYPFQWDLMELLIQYTLEMDLGLLTEIFTDPVFQRAKELLSSERVTWDLNIRSFLNKVNKENNYKVYSMKAAAAFCNMISIISPEKKNDFWVDFNSEDLSISIIFNVSCFLPNEDQVSELKLEQDILRSVRIKLEIIPNHWRLSLKCKQAIQISELIDRTTAPIKIIDIIFPNYLKESFDKCGIYDKFFHRVQRNYDARSKTNFSSVYDLSMSFNNIYLQSQTMALVPETTNRDVQIKNVDKITESSKFENKISSIDYNNLVPPRDNESNDGDTLGRNYINDKFTVLAPRSTDKTSNTKNADCTRYFIAATDSDNTGGLNDNIQTTKHCSAANKHHNIYVEKPTEMYKIVEPTDTKILSNTNQTISDGSKRNNNVESTDLKKSDPGYVRYSRIGRRNRLSQPKVNNNDVQKNLKVDPYEFPYDDKPKAKSRNAKPKPIYKPKGRKFNAYERVLSASAKKRNLADKDLCNSTPKSRFENNRLTKQLNVRTEAFKTKKAVVKPAAKKTSNEHEVGTPSQANIRNDAVIDSTAEKLSNEHEVGTPSHANIRNDAVIESTAEKPSNEHEVVGTPSHANIRNDAVIEITAEKPSNEHEVVVGTPSHANIRNDAVIKSTAKKPLNGNNEESNSKNTQQPISKLVNFSYRRHAQTERGFTTKEVVISFNEDSGSICNMKTTNTENIKQNPNATTANDRKASLRNRSAVCYDVDKDSDVDEVVNITDIADVARHSHSRNFSISSLEPISNINDTYVSKPSSFVAEIDMPMDLSGNTDKKTSENKVKNHRNTVKKPAKQKVTKSKAIKKPKKNLKSIAKPKKELKPEPIKSIKPVNSVQSNACDSSFAYMEDFHSEVDVSVVDHPALEQQTISLGKRTREITCDEDNVNKKSKITFNQLKNESLEKDDLLTQNPIEKVVFKEHVTCANNDKMSIHENNNPVLLDKCTHADSPLKANIEFYNNNWILQKFVDNVTTIPPDDDENEVSTTDGHSPIRANAQTDPIIQSSADEQSLKVNICSNPHINSMTFIQQTDQLIQNKTNDKKLLIDTDKIVNNMTKQHIEIPEPIENAAQRRSPAKQTPNGKGNISKMVDKYQQGVMEILKTKQQPIIDGILESRRNFQKEFESVQGFAKDLKDLYKNSKQHKNNILHLENLLAQERLKIRHICDDLEERTMKYCEHLSNGLEAWAQIKQKANEDWEHSLQEIKVISEEMKKELLRQHVESTSKQIQQYFIAIAHDML